MRVKTINPVKTMQLNKSEFDRLMLIDDFFQKFISNKVFLDENISERHIIRDFVFKTNVKELHDSDINNGHNLLKTRNNILTHVNAILISVNECCKEYFYLDEQEIVLYFSSKSDMDLFFLKTKIMN
jgi:hypothetical protein